MKYVSRDPNGVFDLARYEDYLDSERAALAEVIGDDDLLTIDRFHLTGPQSFHDSRLQSLAVVSSPDRVPHVELCLKGSYFDRHFHLRYDHISFCRIEMPFPEEDLLVHEVRFDGALLVHELHFAGGHVIELGCDRLRFQEVLDSVTEEGHLGERRTSK